MMRKTLKTFIEQQIERYIKKKAGTAFKSGGFAVERRKSVCLTVKFDDAGPRPIRILMTRVRYIREAL